MTTEDTENTERENDLQCELAAWELLREAEEKYTALATEHMLAVNKFAEERDEAKADAARIADILSGLDDTKTLYYLNKDRVLFEVSFKEVPTSSVPSVSSVVKS